MKDVMNTSTKITGAGCSILIPDEAVPIAQLLNRRGDLLALERADAEAGSVRLDKNRVRFVVACASMKEAGRKKDNVASVLSKMITDEYLTGAVHHGQD